MHPILYLIPALLLTFPPLPAAAQLPASAQPGSPAAALPQAELIEKLKTNPVVVELYTSQACMFCPQADRLLADLAAATPVIALACHVDYFDLKVGSFARPFCGERQTRYMSQLHGGPNYTPQMVIGGRYDVIGYKSAEVIAAIDKAAGQARAIAVTSPEPGVFVAALPALAADAGAESYELWLAIYDRPREVEVSEGYNRGARVAYANVVSQLEPLDPWDGKPEQRRLKFTLPEGKGGFAVLAQDSETGAVVAAGKFGQ